MDSSSAAEEEDEEQGFPQGEDNPLRYPTPNNKLREPRQAKIAAGRNKRNAHPTNGGKCPRVPAAAARKRPVPEVVDNIEKQKKRKGDKQSAVGSNEVSHTDKEKNCDGNAKVNVDTSDVDDEPIVPSATNGPSTSTASQQDVVTIDSDKVAVPSSNHTTERTGQRKSNASGGGKTQTAVRASDGGKKPT